LLVPSESHPAQQQEDQALDHDTYMLEIDPGHRWGTASHLADIPCRRQMGTWSPAERISRFIGVTTLCALGW